MPDNKQERKQPLERPYFRKTSTGMTFGEILFLGIVKNTGINPKSDIWDYITEKRIQKCPISMDMFRRDFFVFMCSATSYRSTNWWGWHVKYDTISRWQIPEILHSWQEYRY
jgi:hypothetical protein